MADIDEHFYSSYEETAKRYSRLNSSSRNGRLSPTHSAHGNLMRNTLLRMSQEKRAKKVRFYRNGDRFFKGMIYAVSPERFRTFESLLADLTQSPLCDKVVLPNGVRHIFSIDGSRKIQSLDELQEGENYVCASAEVFRRIDYNRSSTPSWNVNVKTAHQEADRAHSARVEITDESIKEFIRPKLVTIIRNGTKPRKAVRVLLNKKTALSFEQVLKDITEAIKLDSGAVRKVFTLDGKQIQCLADFFGEDSVFIAYGPEKYSVDDFALDDNEIKFVSAYRSVRNRERITLKSPGPARRLSNGSNSGASSPRLTRRGSPGMRSGPISPLLSRKQKPPVPAKPKMVNGVPVTNGNGCHSPTSPDLPDGLVKRYRVGKLIGEGNFAVVKTCADRAIGKEFALKIIDKTKCQGKERMITNEVSILRQLKHPNIVLLIEDFDAMSAMYLVMEVVKGGDLFDAITKSTKYTERDASGMLYNLASALTYLHSLNIVHRDIKPENLLVCEHEDGSKSLKIGDFGLATMATEKLYTVCGTPTYVAPEILAETGYGVKVDCWATGVITYILLCGFPPFVSDTNNQDELFDKILDGHYDFLSPFWDDISDSARELVNGLLTTNPDDRYSAEEMLEHEWVADDTAKDNNMQLTVSREMSRRFVIKHKSSLQSAAIHLIASTPLDKGSRFFQGRKVPLSVADQDDDDETF